jgi:DNA-binding FadR family transcriptional regulator
MRLKGVTVRLTASRLADSSPGPAAALRALIAEGRLPPYTRLPSERELALALGVSRNTVTGAFARCALGGLTWSRPVA